MAPVAVAVPIHENALPLLGGAAPKSLSLCSEVDEEVVGTAPVYSTRAFKPSMKTILAQPCAVKC